MSNRNGVGSIVFLIFSSLFMAMEIYFLSLLFFGLFLCLKDIHVHWN